MAKKYLLYIHDERFEKEQEKSKLVNQLLDNHYDAEHYRNMPTPKNTITIAKRYDAFVEKPLDKTDYHPAPSVWALPEPQNVKLCKKHGLPVLSGRTICGQKDCK